MQTHKAPPKSTPLYNNSRAVLSHHFHPSFVHVWLHDFLRLHGKGLQLHRALDHSNFAEAGKKLSWKSPMPKNTPHLRSIYVFREVTLEIHFGTKITPKRSNSPLSAKRPALLLQQTSQIGHTSCSHLKSGSPHQFMEENLWKNPNSCIKVAEVKRMVSPARVVSKKLREKLFETWVSMRPRRLSVLRWKHQHVYCKFFIANWITPQISSRHVPTSSGSRKPSKTMGAFQEFGAAFFSEYPPFTGGGIRNPSFKFFFLRPR